MASKFTITAELNLQTKNLNQVVNNLRQQFQGADLNIKIKDLTKVESQLRSVSKSAVDASKDFNEAGNAFNQAFKRFTVITAVTGTLVGFTRAVKKSVGEAIEFEREVVKISQASGKTVTQLQSLVNEVGNVATTFGASSKELLNSARTLTQAGFAADRVTSSLKILAQTDLAATFDSIQDTTEGAIALLNQFGRVAQKTGQEAKFLERSFSAINQVSKEFAVESSDLITAIRTTGSAFESAGGNLNELIALFTSVRSTTRESAESIATGFRTIFTRVQRVDTINALRNLGIELQDVEGKFVGPLEATKRLSAALSSIDPRDFRFNLIVEELGGFRQVSKVIPLIQQFTVAQKALGVAQGASGTLAKDAQTAQQSLAVQIAKTREEFSRFIRELVGSSSFQDTAKFLLGLANAFIKVADSIKPLLPLIAGFAAIKIGNALGVGLRSFASKGASQRAVPIGFAGGGFVPGSGNGDTVPAMLTPGEFVIRKSSVKKLGAGNLARMNKYAGGGFVVPVNRIADNKTAATATIERKDPSSKSPIKVGLEKDSIGVNSFSIDTVDFYVKDNKYKAKTGNKVIDIPDHFIKTLKLNNKLSADLFEVIVHKLVGGTLVAGNAPLDVVSGNKLMDAKFKPEGVDDKYHAAGKTLNYLLGRAQGKGNEGYSANKKNVLQIKPNQRIGKTPLTTNPDEIESGKTFKYFHPRFSQELFAEEELSKIKKRVYAITATQKEKLEKMEENYEAGNFPSDQKEKLAFIKNLYNLRAIKSLYSDTESNFYGKLAINKLQRWDSGYGNVDYNAYIEEAKTEMAKAKINKIKPRKFATGGLVPGSGNGDTVPAMLTPGEFVIRKSSVQKLGIDKLHKINKFALGGPAEKFKSARAITIPRTETYTYDKPAGADVDEKSPDGKMYKVNALDRLDYNRINHLIDIDKENVPKDLKDQYDSAKKADDRGRVFERILLALGKVQSLSAMQNARLDAISATGNPSEIKSRIQQMNNKDFEEKLWGAIVSNADGSLAEMAMRQRMNSNRWTDGDDIFDVGTVDVFEDITRGLGKEINAKEIKTDLEIQQARQQKEMTKAGIANARAKLQKAATAVIGANNDKYVLPGKVTKPLSGKGEIYADTITAVRQALNIDNVADLWTAIAQMTDAQVEEAVRNSIQRRASGGFIEKFANGGFSSGTDTVPAMLTPGEFVINKKSAQKIGYSRLHRMNKVGKYATGGVVQEFNIGGGVSQEELSSMTPDQLKSIGYLDTPTITKFLTPSSHALINILSSSYQGIPNLGALISKNKVDFDDIKNDLLRLAGLTTFSNIAPPKDLYSSVYGPAFSHVIENLFAFDSDSTLKKNNWTGSVFDGADTTKLIQILRKKIGKEFWYGDTGVPAKNSPSPAPSSSPEVVDSMLFQITPLLNQFGKMKGIGTFEGASGASLMLPLSKFSLDDVTKLKDTATLHLTQIQTGMSKTADKLKDKYKPSQPQDLKKALKNYTQIAAELMYEYSKKMEKDYSEFLSKPPEVEEQEFFAQSINSTNRKEIIAKYLKGIQTGSKQELGELGATPISFASDVNLKSKNLAKYTTEEIKAIAAYVSGPGATVGGKRVGAPFGSGGINSILDYLAKGQANKIPFDEDKQKQSEELTKLLDSAVSKKSFIPEKVYSGIHQMRLQDVLNELFGAELLKRVGYSDASGSSFQFANPVKAAEILKGSGKIGKTFSIPSFLSTSRDISIAHRFARDYDRSALLEIATKRSKLGRGKNIFLDSTEREHVLPRDSKFRLDDISTDGKRLVFNVQQLRRGGAVEDAPLVDDILQASGAILPHPEKAIQAILNAGGGAVDMDRTLKRTVGDLAYAKAKTPEEKSAVLKKYFRDDAARLNDVKSAPLTQFGRQLKAYIESGQIDPNKVQIISKSGRTKGLAEYLSSLFGIPTANMMFTEGGSKQPAMNALRAKGPRVDRVQKKAIGGIIRGIKGALGFGSKQEEQEEAPQTRIRFFLHDDELDHEMLFLQIQRTKDVARQLMAGTYKGDQKDLKESLYPKSLKARKYLKAQKTKEFEGNQHLAQSVKDIFDFLGIKMKVPTGVAAEQAASYARYLIPELSPDELAAIQKATGRTSFDREELSVRSIPRELPGTYQGAYTPIDRLAGQNNLQMRQLTVLNLPGGVNPGTLVHESIHAWVDTLPPEAKKRVIERTRSFLSEETGGTPNEQIMNHLAKVGASSYSGTGIKNNAYYTEGALDSNIEEFITSSFENIRKKYKDTKENKDLARKMGRGLVGALNEALGKEFSDYKLNYFANGGLSKGTDTIPAMLTPGEFVINKKSAEKIGYSNLNRMNKVGRYAKGGAVRYLGSGSSGPEKPLDDDDDDYSDYFIELGPLDEEPEMDSGHKSIIHPMKDVLSRARRTLAEQKTIKRPDFTFRKAPSLSGFDFDDDDDFNLSDLASSWNSAGTEPEKAPSSSGFDFDRYRARYRAKAAQQQSKPMHDAAASESVAPSTNPFISAVLPPNMAKEGAILTRVLQDVEKAGGEAKKSIGVLYSKLQLLGEEVLTNAEEFKKLKEEMYSVGTDGTKPSSPLGPPNPPKPPNPPNSPPNPPNGPPNPPDPAYVSTDSLIKSAKAIKEARAKAEENALKNSKLEEALGKSIAGIDNFGDNISRLATNFAIIGGVVQSVAVQFTGLSDTIKQGVSAFGASFSAFQSIGGSFTGIVANRNQRRFGERAAALKADRESGKIKTDEAYQNKLSALTKEAEQSSKRLASFNAGLTGISAVLAGATALVAYFEQVAKESSEKLGKSLNALAEDVNKVSLNKLTQESIQSFADASRSASLSSNLTSGTGSSWIAGAGLGVGAIIALTTAFPPLGIAAAATAAALTAAGVLFLKAEKEAANRQALITKSAQEFARGMYDATREIQGIQKFLLEADKKSDKEIFERTSAGVKVLVSSTNNLINSQTQAAKAFGGLSRIPKETQSNFDLLAQSTQRLIQEFDKLIGIAQQRAAKEIGRQVESGNYDVIGQVVNATDQQKENIRQRNEAELRQRFQPQINDLRLAGFNSEADKAEENLKNLIDASTNKGVYEFKLGLMESARQSLSMREALLKEKILREKLLGTLAKQIAIETALTNFEYALNRAAASVDSITAAYTGSISGLTTRGTVDSRVLDVTNPMEQNSADYDKAISTIGKVDQETADNLRASQKANLELKKLFSVGNEQINLQEFTGANQGDFTKKIIDLLRIDNKAVRAGIQTALESINPQQFKDMSQKERSEKFLEIFEGVNKELTERGKRILNLWSQLEQQNAKIYDQITASQNKQVEMQLAGASATETLLKNLDSVYGRQTSLAEKNARRFSRQQILAGGLAGNPNAIGARLSDIRGQLAAGNLEQGDAQKLASEANKLEKALGELADQGQRTADTLEEIAKYREQREAYTSSATRYAFGSDEDRVSMDQAAAATQMAVSQGTIEGLSGEQRQAVSGMLDELGPLGKDIKKELTARFYEGRGQGNIANLIRNASTPEQMLAQELTRIFNQEQQARSQLFNQEANLQVLLGNEIAKNTTEVMKLSETIKNQTKLTQDQINEMARDAGVERVPLEDQLKEVQDAIATTDNFIKTFNGKIEALGKSLGVLQETLANFNVKNAKNNLANASAQEKQQLGEERQGIAVKDFKAAQEAELNATTQEEKDLAIAEQERALENKRKAADLINRATMERGANRSFGGLIYRAGGGFAPRGTDTVPAMLTPGEFVMRKSAVDKYGTGMMSQINAKTFGQGGGVGSTSGGYDFNPLTSLAVSKNSYEELATQTELNEKGNNALIEQNALLKLVARLLGNQEKIINAFPPNVANKIFLKLAPELKNECACDGFKILAKEFNSFGKRFNDAIPQLNFGPLANFNRSMKSGFGADNNLKDIVTSNITQALGYSRKKIEPRPFVSQKPDNSQGFVAEHNASGSKVLESFTVPRVHRTGTSKAVQARINEYAKQNDLSEEQKWLAKFGDVLQAPRPPQHGYQRKYWESIQKSWERRQGGKYQKDKDAQKERDFNAIADELGLNAIADELGLGYGELLPDDVSGGMGSDINGPMGSMGGGLRSVPPAPPGGFKEFDAKKKLEEINELKQKIYKESGGSEGGIGNNSMLGDWTQELAKLEKEYRENTGRKTILPGVLPGMEKGFGNRPKDKKTKNLPGMDRDPNVPRNDMEIGKGDNRFYWPGMEPPHTVPPKQVNPPGPGQTVADAKQAQNIMEERKAIEKKIEDKKKEIYEASKGKGSSEKAYQDAEVQKLLGQLQDLQAQKDELVGQKDTKWANRKFLYGDPDLAKVEQAKQQREKLQKDIEAKKKEILEMTKDLGPSQNLLIQDIINAPTQQLNEFLEGIQKEDQLPNILKALEDLKKLESQIPPNSINYGGAPRPEIDPSKIGDLQKQRNERAKKAAQEEQDRLNKMREQAQSRASDIAKPLPSTDMLFPIDPKKTEGIVEQYDGSNFSTDRPTPPKPPVPEMSDVPNEIQTKAISEKHKKLREESKRKTEEEKAKQKTRQEEVLKEVRRKDAENNARLDRMAKDPEFARSENQKQIEMQKRLKQQQKEEQIREAQKRAGTTGRPPVQLRGDLMDRLGVGDLKGAESLGLTEGYTMSEREKIDRAMMDSQATQEMIDKNKERQRKQREELFRSSMFYRAGGGSIFKPRGTDTVPAMLTPGEFVVKKSAVDKIGLSTLQHINNGGKVQYAFGGKLIDRNGFGGGPGSTSSFRTGWGGSGIGIGNISNLGSMSTRWSASMGGYGAVNPYSLGMTSNFGFGGAGGYGSSFLSGSNIVGGFTSAGLTQGSRFYNGPISSGMGMGFGGMPLVQYGGMTDPFGFTNYFSGMLTGGVNPFNHMGAFDAIFNQRPRMFAAANDMFQQGMYNRMMQNYVNPAMKSIFGRGGGGSRNPLSKYKLPYRNFLRNNGPVDPEGNTLTMEEFLKKYVGKSEYRSNGGLTDTVPAMLTPGEFVMNKNAVDKHGLSFMNSLNNGKVKGFAKGGPVGTNYLANGGSPVGMQSPTVNIDINGIGMAIQTAIQSGFAGVGSLIDIDAVSKLVNSFATFTQSINSLLSKVSGMTMTHNVRVDGNINIGGFDSRMIANAIKSEVVNLVINQVNQILNQRNNEAKN